MTPRRVGLFGGTFDPIHHGHLAIAEEVRVSLELNEMFFIPAGHPPHKPGRVITPVEQRLAMLELAIATNPHFSISLVEVDRPGPSYLVDTLHILREQWGNEIELYFVVGWDSLEELHTWYNPLGILAQLTFLVAVARPGYVEENEYNKQLEARLPGITQRLLVVQAPRLDISSTELRRRVASGKPIKYQVPDAVESYIFQHNLYQTGQ
ncbi:nicotinate-nucleotide adenylyltransferase [Ktedonosporobacter rubrisoli]|uniref:Probable nicotinate-nucleotide adenylyltransferase n=1 Tax=Ktedonosporobacter rubrisoli TaxID=2509675 RepID=A0A4P6K6U8_KTERU|nr:nicotinate-nucleotide adenylyltransferase [Ktedonosporobacter rubrisoli]